VTHIVLPNNGLGGIIPAALGDLSQLAYINIRGNKIVGTLPASLGNLLRLTYLNVATNQMMGTIPPQLGNLARLASLGINDNKLTGTIPTEIAKLSLLGAISLSSNKITGTIPLQLGALVRLTFLGLHSNNLTGTVPGELGNLSKLTSLYLMFNQFTGSIPIELGKLSKLNILRLDNNALSGAMPQLGALAELTSLGLHNNTLTGTLPTWLGNLSKLTSLGLQNNTLTGTLPTWLGNLSKLTELYLQLNQFTGSIPAEFSKLTKLEYLGLHNNTLTGTLPTSLGNLSKLTNLNLEFNQFTGSIPAEFSQLTKLDYLGLQHNALSGSIPPQVGALGVLTGLNLFNNKLSGTLPAALGLLANLKQFVIDHNKITGSIPPSMGNLSRLIVFSIYENLITGSIPDTMGRLSKLKMFCVSNNALTGTIPTLVSLPELLVLQMQDNQLSGSIPNVLCQASKLQVVQFNGNNLTGTIPHCIGNLTKLDYLSLQSNMLSGTIPASVGLMKTLQQLWLGNNRLTGSMPAELGSLENLEMIYLENNAITGTIPASIGNCSKLKMLSLYLNQISGQIPPSLGQLSALQYLWMSRNLLSGNIPSSFGLLVDLLEIYLHANKLAGTIPITIGRLRSLDKLLLDRNEIGGPMPLTFSNLTNLKVLSISENRLSGSIPSLPLSTEHIVLHRNRLSGSLPSFVAHAKLRSLTLFGQELKGRLILPSSAPKLSIVLVHSNRLSCHIESGDDAPVGNSTNSSYDARLSSARNLLGPGNSFSDPTVAWAATSSVSFIWVDESILREWLGNILIMFGGLFILATWIGRTIGFRSFVFFAPSRGLSAMQLWCSQSLAASIPFLGGVMALYVAGSNLFLCGRQSSRITITQLSDSVVIEWSVAVAACLYTLFASCFVILFSRKVETEYTRTTYGTGEYVKLDTVLLMKSVAVLCLPVLFLAIFPALYAVSANVPRDNVWNLSAAALSGDRTAGGGILFVITHMIIPRLVTKVVKFVSTDDAHGDELAARIIMTCHLWIMVLVPAAVTIAVHQDCSGGWLRLWSTCEDPESFNINVLVTSPGLANLETIIPLKGVSETGGYNFAYSGNPGSSLSKYDLPVMTHSQICATPREHGRCSRAVIDTLGSLIVTKVFFEAFLSPFVALMLQTELIRALKRGGKNIVGFKAWSTPREREDKIELNIETVGLVALLDKCLVLGFTVPVMFPLSFIAVLMHYATLHQAISKGFEQVQEQRPFMGHLRHSVWMGCALVMWFFAENDLHGKMLVLVGVPIMGLAPYGFAMVMRLHAPKSTLSLFREPAKSIDLSPDRRAPVAIEMEQAAAMAMPPTMGTADPVSWEGEVIRL